MKKLFNIAAFVSVLLTGQYAFGQAEEKPEPSINLRYFNQNGSRQYLQVSAMIKENNKLQPVAGASIQIFLGEVSKDLLIGKIKTDEKGDGKIAIPVSLKAKWNETTEHTFIAVTEGTKRYEGSTTELEVVKAKIVIDTLNEDGVRKVTAQLLSDDGTGWLPVKDAELRVGVRRLGGDLNIGEEESYTTDSTGQVTAEFKLEKLPATDAQNNIMLVVKTEDNEQFVNLVFEKKVPWGLYTKYSSNFNKRSLWGTRDKTPMWLLFMAGSIVAGVWGVLIYLVFQLIKIKRQGSIKSEQFADTEQELAMDHAT